MELSAKHRKSERPDAAKKKVPADLRNYYVTQPHENTAEKEKERLATGVSVGTEVIAYRDGILTVFGR